MPFGSCPLFRPLFQFPCCCLRQVWDHELRHALVLLLPPLRPLLRPAPRPLLARARLLLPHHIHHPGIPRHLHMGHGATASHSVLRQSVVADRLPDRPGKAVGYHACMQTAGRHMHAHCGRHMPETGSFARPPADTHVNLKSTSSGEVNRCPLAQKPCHMLHSTSHMPKQRSRARTCCPACSCPHIAHRCSDDAVYGRWCDCVTVYGLWDDCVTHPTL